MSSTVKKIFITLITIVALVALGAFILNIVMPNATKQMVNTVERMVYKGTGIELDLNGDGTTGKNASTTEKAADGKDAEATSGIGVEGFN